MPQLVGVDHRPDGRHLTARRYVQREHVDHPALAVVANRPWLAVHDGRTDRARHRAEPLEHTGQHRCHPLPAAHRPAERPRLAPAVAVEDHLRRQQRQQFVDIAALRHREEPLRELPRPARGQRRRIRARLPDVPPGPGEDLPAVRLGLRRDPADLVVSVPEHLTEQEHRPFHRRQALQQHQERHRQRIGQFRVFRRLIRHHDNRLGEPRAHVGLAALPCRTEVVDRQPRRGGDQVGPR
jgi:hypothetical protein